MDELDKKILGIVSKKIHEPISYENAIRKALYKKNNNVPISVAKKVAIFILCIITISGAVFANQIFNIINKFENEKLSNSLRNNEYIQKLDMDYKTINDLSIKIDFIAIDDFEIQIGIDYLYKEKITSAESNIIIKDENNNLILKIDDIEQIDKWGTDNKRHKYGEYIVNEEETLIDKDEIQKQLANKYKSSYENIEDNNIKRVINLYTDIDLQKFPKSKKMYIELENITLKNGTNIVKRIRDKLQFEIDLDKKFLSRAVKSYIQEDIASKQEFTVLVAKLSNMQLKVKMEYCGEKDLNKILNTNELDDIQIFDEANNKYFSAESIYILDNKILNISYDSNGNKLSNRLLIIINNTVKIPIIEIESSR